MKQVRAFQKVGGGGGGGGGGGLTFSHYIMKQVRAFQKVGGGGGRGGCHLRKKIYRTTL